MSASSKKKLRKEQNAAAMTKKQQAAAKEAKKLKIYTVTFWVILVLCVSLVAGLALKGPVLGVASRMATALVVGEHKVTAMELNYFYIDAINEYVNNYSSYISYFMNVSAPLSSQVYDSTTGETWADYFLETAISSAKNTYALYDAAIAAGHTLSDEEKAAMQTLYDNMDVYAKAKEYRNASAYLKSVYGDGANTKTYKAYYEVVIMASSYYSAHSEELKESYTAPILREFEGKESYKYNSYTYYSHYLDLTKFQFGGTKGADGKTTYTEEETKYSIEYLEKVAKALSDPEINTIEKLNAAIAEMEKQLELDKAAYGKDKTEGETKAVTSEIENENNTTDTENKTEDTTDTEDKTDSENKEENKTEDKEDTKTYSTATENKDKLYSSVSSLMQEWIRNADRKDGDITSLKYTTTSKDADGKETETLKGYYIVLYKSVNDNQYALANVRHILIAYEGGTTNSSTGQKTYTDAEKQKARDKAVEVLEEWLKGEKTEDSFAALAKKYTADGNGDEGGLYEDIYPGQMVTAFNDWCFDEVRKAGDYGKVETEYGVHLMYYSGDSETTYRDYMVTNDKLSADMEAWQTALVDAISLTEKTTWFVNKDYIISSAY